MVERLDAMFAAGDCPDAIVVFVDAGPRAAARSSSTPSSTGPLHGLPVRRGRRRSSTSATRRSPSRDHRGLTGKSSGGYGAMVVPMLRPDVFGALASHAGDALFECLLPARVPARSRARCATTSTAPTRCSSSSWPRPTTSTAERFGKPFEVYGYALRLLARPRPPGQGAAAVRPRDRAADRRRLGAVARSCDPVRMAPRARRRAALACGASTSTPARATSGSSTSARRRSRASSTKLGVDAHARAVRRQARRHHLPLPGRDPRARARRWTRESAKLPRVSTTTDQELAFAGPAALAELVRLRQVTAARARRAVPAPDRADQSRS